MYASFEYDGLFAKFCNILAIYQKNVNISFACDARCLQESASAWDALPVRHLQAYMLGE
jgi:hypothetical protein